MKAIDAKFILYLTVLGACGGCATTYGAKTAGTAYGYSDTEIGDRKYSLSFNANEFTTTQDAMKYWRQRAAELCGSDSFEHSERSKILTTKVISFVGFVPIITEYHKPYVEGTVMCKQN
jgi:hypothetical protein